MSHKELEVLPLAWISTLSDHLSSLGILCCGSSESSSEIQGVSVNLFVVTGTWI